MTTSESGSAGGGERPPTEEELRAAYESQIKQIRVEHVLLEDVVTLVNLAMRRTGLVEGTEEERDPEQVRLAIEAVRAVLPLLEQAVPAQAAQLRDALSQLQLAYVRIGGKPGEAAADPATRGPAPAGSAPGRPEAPSAGTGEPSETGEPGEPGEPRPPAEPGEPGPAQRSGRLWVPGQ